MRRVAQFIHFQKRNLVKFVTKEESKTTITSITTVIHKLQPKINTTDKKITDILQLHTAIIPQFEKISNSLIHTGDKMNNVINAISDIKKDMNKMNNEIKKAIDMFKELDYHYREFVANTYHPSISSNKS